VNVRKASTARSATRNVARGVVCALVAAQLTLVSAQSVAAEVVRVGLGSYNATPPAGARPPSDTSGAPVTPKVTPNVSGKVPTNDWWSSLAWQRYPGNPYSENMFAHPLAFHARSGGLGVSYPSTVTIIPDGRKYEYAYSEDFVLGVAGLSSPDTKVDGWSDWTVSPYWSDGTRTLRASIGHGSPFVFATATGGPAQLTFTSAPTVWSNTGNVLGVSVNGRHYGLFAPTGATWSLNGLAAQSDLAGKGYFSVAVLPSTGALALYRRYAFSFVTGSRVSWSYDEPSARLTTTYTTTTTAKEGTQTGTLLALYRHQWLHTPDPLTSHTYVSPRGTMKVREGGSFTTRMAFGGVLPALPDRGAYDRSRLSSLVSDVANAADPFLGASDTYWTGKALGRLAALVRIADQVGNTAARDKLLSLIKGRVEDWFSAPDGEATRMFHYNSTWGTLVGYPASYGSDAELNDHNFHWGYFIMAAATVAQYDRAWAADSAWGGMTKLLIKDANNYDSADTRFPRLRNFDAYAGHGWASGHQGFAAGNNEESSSEAMNFAAATILFGAATGDKAVRDLGIYLHATQTVAIEQYWFDVDNVVFPTAFDHTTVGMVWSDGGAYATWWTANPEEIHGINFLPITGGSLYLGRRPDYVRTNYADLRAANGGEEQEWRDVIWSFQALADPGAAVTKWNAQWSTYGTEEGESKAHTYHWLYNLDAMGQLDTTVTATVPTYAVFTKGGKRTYVAYNPTSAAVTVGFSDGRALNVPARSLASGDGTGSPPTPTPTPTPSPTASPSPSPTPDPDPTPPPETDGDVLYLIDGARVGFTGPLSTTPGTGAASDTLVSAGGVNRDGIPTNQLVYVIRGISGSYVASRATEFDLYVDAGDVVGNGQQVRVSYDLTGDGSYERVETYHYFATDPVPGWERYTQARGLKSAGGSLGDMSGGTVRIDVWSAIGTGPSTLRTSATSAEGQQSLVRIPFS
jgi:endoglucanase Acf2